MINQRELREQLKSKEWLTKPFELLSDISKICASNPDTAREFVIRALENRSDLAIEYQNILDELTMLVGLYPYVQDGLDELSLRSALMHAAHRADGEMQDFVLHSSQARILRKLMAGESVILSAPTSFGKSLLMTLLSQQRTLKILY